MQKTKHKQKEYPIGFYYEFFFKSRPYDASNCMFMVKMIEDSLIKEDIIENDSPKHIHSITISTKKSDKNKIIAYITKQLC